MLFGQIGICPRKANNSVILKDKNLKQLHNLHMAITNLNPQLWIGIYNGFAIILDLRKTGIAKKTNTHTNKDKYSQFIIIMIHTSQEA